MKYHFNKLTKWVAVGVLALVGAAIYNSNPVMADGYALTMAPMKQKIVINPGELFKASFRISNPVNSTHDTYYKIEIEPFYKNDNNEIEYKAEGDSGKIADWTTLNIPAEGKLAPNEVKEVVFTIDVPESAPAGGQYLSVLVTAGAKPDDDRVDSDDSSNDSNSSGDSGAVIEETKRMAHLVYAEVAGNSIRNGEIRDAALPSFLLSGKITGSAIVKNVGNVHGDAKYLLRVYPLFSDEEIYTNEEDPATYTILPDRELYSEIAWEQTPTIGMFNVEFSVEFEGEKVEISKLVIVCPIWLLFIIFFVIAAIIIWIIVRVRTRNQKRAEA